MDGRTITIDVLRIVVDIGSCAEFQIERELDFCKIFGRYGRELVAVEIFIVRVVPIIAFVQDMRTEEVGIVCTIVVDTVACLLRIFPVRIVGIAKIRRVQCVGEYQGTIVSMTALAGIAVSQVTTHRQPFVYIRCYTGAE